MNKAWEPEFDDWSEEKVSMSSCELATNSISRGEYGVIMQIGTDEENLPVDAAIFWTDEMHLYLRYNWESWYKVSNDDPDNCSNICKRNSATLFLCTTTSIKHHAVKVYHIDRLPEELFGKQESEASDSGKAAQLDFDFPLQSDDEIEKTASVPAQSVSACLAASIGEMGGQLISCIDNGPYYTEVCELNGHLVVATHFNRDGDWLADEEPLDGSNPSWYGTKSIAASPLAYAKALRERISTLIPTDVPILTFVVLSIGCNIINEKECLREWSESNVAFSRCQRLADSKIAALEDLLRDAKGEPRPELAELTQRISEAMPTWPPDLSSPDE